MAKQWSKRKVDFVVFVIGIALYLVMTMPFRLWVQVADITDMRPSAALTPVLGIVFGLPGAIGCAVGSIIADLISGYEIFYLICNAACQLLYGMVPYLMWRKLNKEHDGSEFRLDSIMRLLKFCLVMLVDAVLAVLLTGVLNKAYSVTNFLTAQTLYTFLNVFDAGLLFGCPFFLLIHFLEKKMENLRNGNHDKIFTFSLNERLILNVILTGLGIFIVIGAAVYASHMLAQGSGDHSLWGQIYTFEMLAFNFYFIMSIGFMWFTEKRIAKPVEALAKVAGSYYVEHATDEDRTQMIDACQKYASDNTEVGELARSYIAMVKDLEKYVENLQAVTAEKERINAELTLASNIQAHMLPCIFPAFPDHDEFDIFASMTPAKEVGGDFYDLFMIDNTHLAVVIADVSGKGVPAALFMVIAKTLIKNYAQNGLPASEVFTIVNKRLCEGNDADLFVTAWMGILDITDGTMTYVNAGHNPPMLLLGDKGFQYLKSPAGFVLAGLDITQYKENTLKIEPGDRLFLYTDGITEATSAAQELYGEDRLSAYLNGHTKDTPENVLHGLKADIDAFVGEAEQFDDMTMLMLDFKHYR